ncbi:wasp interacting protein-related [Holotrichia oblita]|uniref:Wasp interacting protein-related n=1 Tax=Holotrichia oblita TaxID=644536 RepID=A0ACB9SSW1_HOLOL|nr:wasp interacting protein-related [Holotrichia oblita]
MELGFVRTKGGEPNSGMDCLQLRQSAGPFHYLISEQAKSLVALQELQHEVGALLEFRDLVIETFPNLRNKMAASSSPTTMTTHSSNIPVAVRRDWEPGIRVRRKLNNKDDSRSKKTESTIQDSGFSTETSSKETHSASSTAMTTSAPSGAPEVDEAEDELWNLLDVIHRKGTRLKNEVEALQGAIRDQNNLQEESNFQRTLFTASADDVRQLKRERDLLLDRVAEMEAEVLASRVHTSRLQEDLENLLGTKHDLEEQLRAILSQRGEINSRIHDLHLQFVSKSDGSSNDDIANVSGVKVIKSSEGARANEPSSSSHKTPRKKTDSSELDRVLGEEVPKVRAPDTQKIAAILEEQDPLVLQKHLLTTTVQNQVLQEKLESAVKKEEGLTDELDKAREENEELKFQLEDKNIELEGTRARVRVLEQLQKPSAIPSPDVIPVSESPPLDHGLTRSEITTASMKAMSPFPLNLQLDHSSSTESAHDQAESTRKGDQKRKPSKIPLVKSYAAPKPPGGGKHSPAPTHTRSRSGESPGRPHSAQSWRNKSEGNSLSGSKSSGSLSKSRNGSLTTAKDSLTGKIRSNDSLSKLRDSPANSFGSGRNTLLRKGSSSSVRRSSSIRDSPDSKMVSNSTKEKSQSQWILSSYNSCEIEYPDSLNETASAPGQTTETSSGQNYQSANNFLWSTASGNGEITKFYDSIDSNLASSLYQPNGEDLAECDSLEKQFSDYSDRK